MITLGPAPLSVRWARVVVPLIMCFAYLTMRVAPATHERIGLGELLTSGVLFVGLTFVAFVALGDLCFPPTPAERAAEDDPESTNTFDAYRGDIAATSPRGRITGDLTPLDGWTDVGYTTEGFTMDDRGALSGRQVTAALTGVELSDDEWEQHTADTEEFDLLTHEYTPQHHTPARGIPAVQEAIAAKATRLEAAARALVPPNYAPVPPATGLVSGKLPTPYLRPAVDKATGRHRKG